MELTDAYVAQVELRTRRRTAELMYGMFPTDAKPRRDAVGILRLGVGRPIERRGQSPRVANLVLTEEIMQTQQVLHGRVVELLAYQSGAESRLPYLYAVADILGAETMRDWKEIWDAAKRGDWATVGSEVLVGNWDAHYGAEPRDRRAVTRLVMDMAYGAGNT